MKSSRHVFSLFALVLLSGLSVSAQTAPSGGKEFKKDGLSFYYPSAWQFNDASDSDKQQLTFGKSDVEAQITIFVFRTAITSPEQMAEAKRILVDKYVAAQTASFEREGAKPQSSPATKDISNAPADGVIIRLTLDGVPGAAEIYWALVGQRLVVLTLFRPDQAVSKAAPAWDMIRNTIKIEAPQPNPSPKP
jgi:hypothetical protein